MKQTIEVLGKVNFLKDNTGITQHTHTFKAEGVVADSEGKKIILAGTVYPSNDASAEGIVYNDVEVTYGDAIGSLLVHGNVLSSRLPVTPSAEAITTLKANGLYMFADND